MASGFLVPVVSGPNYNLNAGRGTVAGPCQGPASRGGAGGSDGAPSQSACPYHSEFGTIGIQRVLKKAPPSLMRCDMCGYSP